MHPVNVYFHVGSDIDVRVLDDKIIIIISGWEEIGGNDDEPPTLR